MYAAGDAEKDEDKTDEITSFLQAHDLEPRPPRHAKWTPAIFEASCERCLRGIEVMTAFCEENYDFIADADTWRHLAVRTLGLMTLRVGAFPSADLIDILVETIEQDDGDYPPPGTYPIHQAVAREYRSAERCEVDAAGYALLPRGHHLRGGEGSLLDRLGHVNLLQLLQARVHGRGPWPEAPELGVGGDCHGLCELAEIQICGWASVALRQEYMGEHSDTTPQPPDQSMAADRAHGTFTAGAKVVVTGLRTAPEMNGCSGVVKSYNATSGRYNVAVEGKPKLSALKPENLLSTSSQQGLAALPKTLRHERGDVVRVKGLVQRPEFNGQEASIIEWIGQRSRYEVKLQSGNSITVKPDNLERVDLTTDDDLAAEDHQTLPPSTAGDKDGRCYVCLEEGGTMHGGCACRAESGRVHLRCAIGMAETNKKRWTWCPTCEQYWTGPFALEMNRGWHSSANRLGRDNPKREGECFESALSLAQSLSNAGNTAEALSLVTPVLTAAEKKHGVNGRITLLASETLATIHETAGDLATAVVIYNKNLSAYRQSQRGSPTQHHLNALGRLATLYTRLNDDATALPLLQENLDGNIAKNGPDDLRTLASSEGVAVVLIRMGNTARALPLLTKVVAGRRQILGGAHEGTLNALINLGDAQRIAGHHVEAAKLLREGRAGMIALGGKSHPSTQNAERCLALTEQEGSTDANKKDSTGRTSLMNLVCGQRPTAVMARIETELARPGLKVNTEDAEGWAALHLAVPIRRNQPEKHLAVSRLLEADADPDSCGSGTTALHMASRLGYHKIVAALLRGGATVNQPCTRFGKTALHQVADAGSVRELSPHDTHNLLQTARLLLQAGAAVDAELKKDRETALVRAVMYDHKEMCELLLEAGANPNQVTDKPFGTPVVLATMQGQRCLYPLLIAGAVPKHPSSSSSAAAAAAAMALQQQGAASPLTIATMTRNERSARLLIAAGADVAEALQHGGGGSGPGAAWLREHALSIKCACCGAAVGAVSPGIVMCKCTACNGGAWYCDKTCQSTHWAREGEDGHKELCTLRQKLKLGSSRTDDAQKERSTPD